MSANPIDLALATGWLTRRAAVLALGLVLLFTPAGQGQTLNAPTYFNNYFLTGDYVVSGVGLKGKDAVDGVVDGFATGTITINTVPATATAVAAFLYWGTVVDSNGLNDGLTGAKFKGHDITPFTTVLNDPVITPPGTSPCWSSGGGAGGGASKFFIFRRADVLRFFDVDSNGKYILNAAHQVRLRDSGATGNITPFTLGASLVIVYRDLAPAVPFSSIVVYDGGWVLNQGSEVVTKTLEGFYDSSSDPSAKLSIIVGEGQDNFSERVLLDGNLVATNPFISLGGDRWDNPTFDVSDFLPGDASSATVTIDHDGTPYDCLSGGAFILKTTVDDDDEDGIPDKLESAGTSGSLSDPTGELLPDLYAMGARPDHKDLLVEVGAMWAPAETTYGTGANMVTDEIGHNHTPVQAVVKMVGDAFFSAPVSNPDGVPGINVHFDLGNGYPVFSGVDAYAERYVIRGAQARGGELIKEVACIPNPAQGVECRFPFYPGTVRWMLDYASLRAGPVKANGTAFDRSIPEEAAAEALCRTEGNCRRRFDRVRKTLFHWALYAHSRGTPKSSDPASPDFYVPGTSSGIAALPGNGLMMTLGGWGNGFIGPDLSVATTTMHELGHNFYRGHTGNPFTGFERNCNPNFLSVMNYLFQAQGLHTGAGVPVLDYSRTALADINESSVPSGLGTLDYVSAWYAPMNFVAQSLGTTAAKRHCDGTPLSAAEELARLGGGGMVRVNGTSVAPPIDWNGDLQTPDLGIPPQDVTFNGVTNTAANVLKGSANRPDDGPIGRTLQDIRGSVGNTVERDVLRRNAEVRRLQVSIPVDRRSHAGAVDANHSTPAEPSQLLGCG